MRFAIGLIAVTIYAQAPAVPPLYHPTPEERQQMEQKSAELDAALRPLRAKIADDILVDAEVYLKAARFVLRFDEFYSKASVEQTMAVLDSGLERTRRIAANDLEYTVHPGSLTRAYRSRVDGSIQPYALILPQNYKAGAGPEWLEVVLHGRGATLTEVSFLSSHNKAKPPAADHEFIQLDVFGRANNAYRWAGETDVWEAIESVKKRYKIDPDRIVLRGFSMGGAGAWHIGLHYPDRWAAIEAGAGFAETKIYASVPNPPPYVHIYDAVDYALNAFNVPTVGYGGEDDPQLRASTLIRQALQSEGYKFTPDGLNYRTEDLRAIFLVGPKTKHQFHPESKKTSDAFLTRYQSPGILTQPKLRFVTYTTRYNHCFWVTVDELERQYERAQVDGDIDHVTTTNVARLTIRREPPTSTVTIDGQKFPVKSSATFEKAAGKWRPAAPVTGLRKIHGLQGPIDDAFMDAFLCVRPTGASPQLDTFAKEFPRWMRGDIRIKSEAEVTPADVRDFNMILFGTPSTNQMIGRALAGTPIHWTAESITVGNRKFDAATHTLSMIYPNPANRKRYVVINSGHTFHEADFLGTNALLYPRVGDWAITDTRTGAIVAEGVFDRNWQL